MKQWSGQPRVLVVGGGAREHAIVWKLAESDDEPTIFCAPGNPGIGECVQRVDIDAMDLAALVDFAKGQSVNLVVPGPEAPLAAGIADLFAKEGIPVFGPTAAAARLESSKAFAKSVMKAAGVPTADYAEFTDADAAKEYVREHGAPIVVKADGLAAGKGVTVAQTVEEALRAVEDALVGNRFGESGHRVVIESCLTGTEVSLMFFVSGQTVVPMLPARDHKRIYDNDEGPNTGGMGAFAPVTAFVDAGLVAVVERDIVRPTLAELARLGTEYRGVLYVGLMVTETGPQVIEFNCRFGDPETQVVLPLLSSDLLRVMWATATGSLAADEVAWKPGAAVSVVLAAQGYPQKPRTGDVITMPQGGAGEDFDSGTSGGYVFHAGTAEQDGRIITSGGRVLSATGWGRDFEEAKAAAYRLADAIHFEGKQMRTDIGHRQDL